MTRSIPDPALHVFIAGDASDLDAIALLLSGLPANAYGQVMVEATEDEWDGALEAPRRVHVVRLPHDPFGLVGDTVVSACAAWMAEWMPDDVERSSRVFVTWLGCSDNQNVTAMDRRLSRSLDAAHSGGY
ncbi:SIP domain-containing protein [Naasia lichenicola]|uniref:Siderophore-interacting protein n=1 Tax=Naasia lichenicola TaxID=2565933 RepID=A0A4S4FJR7_9MICO|nr:SIP domain-containing protein [Naasia lichenicola]THG30164.1 siderophore-interacting protein [Naasia lichenicola]